MRRSDYPRFKQLTPENWLQNDEPATKYISIAKDSIGKLMNGERWLREALQYQLSHNVPQEIHTLLDVGRGAFAYGFFYYPLYTLGAEQVYRVGEAAISKRYKALGGPKIINRKKADFSSKIDWLFSTGELTADDKEYWHSLRHLRNEASHPEQQDIITPPTALSMLRDVVESINDLFPEQSSAGD